MQNAIKFLRRRTSDSTRRVGLLLVSTARLLLLLVAALSYNALHAQTWSGAGSNDWHLAGNWIPANVPDSVTETAVFGVSTVLDPTVTAATDILGVTFNAGASAYNIQVNNTLYVGSGGMVNNSGVTQTVTINNVVFSLYGNGDGGTNVHYVIAGAGAAFQAVDSASLGSSVITSNGGDIQVAHNATGESARVILNNGRLFGYMNSVFTLGSLEGSGVVEFSSIFGGASTQTLSLGHLNTSTAFSGVIGESGISLSLIKVGTGTFTLTGNSTYTGGTTISGGALQIGNSGTSGSVTGNILNNASLIFNRSNNLSYGGNISGTGTLTKLGAGTLTLSGQSDFSGGTYADEGTLVAASNTALGTGLATVRNGALLINSGVELSNAIIVEGSGTFTNSGTLAMPISTAGASGETAISVTGNGAVVSNLVSGVVIGGKANSALGSIGYPGGYGLLALGTASTFFNAGSITGGDGGDGSSAWSDGGIGGYGVRLEGSAHVFTNTGTISGGNAGSGLANMSGGAGIYLSGTGHTIVTGGAILGGLSTAGDRANSLYVSGSHTVRLLEGFSFGGDIDMPSGSLTFDQDEYAATLSTRITGAGSIRKSGTNSLTLTGNNTYSGGTTVAEGRLIAGANSALGSGPLSVTGNGTLQVEAGVTLSRTVFLTEAGSFSNFGSLEMPLVPYATGAVAMTVTGSGSVIENHEGASIKGGTGSNDTGLPLPGGDGLVVMGTAATIRNAGVISGGSAAVGFLPPDVPPRFAGIGVRLDGDGNTLVTSGTIAAGSYGHSQTAIFVASGSQTLTLLSGFSLVGAINLEGGTLTFEQNEYAATVSNEIFNGGSIRKSGTNSLTLTGSNTFGGTTTVTAGTLAINGLHTGTGAFTVGSGATLAGSGTITASVTVENGGTIGAGNSPGTLTVGELVLSGSSRAQFELGAPIYAGLPGVDSDLIDVVSGLSGTSSGNLTLGGIFDLITSTDFGTGSYLLFNYDGTLTGDASDLLFGLAPAGYRLAIDTATDGSVFLNVSYEGLQFWDGTQTEPDGGINGGSGTWDSATTNWTNSDGNANSAWGGLTAVFTATGGTVDVVSDVSVAGLQFGASGYVLTGTGSIALQDEQTEVRVDSGVTADIETTLTGTGGLVKSGTGTLILRGDNDYSGDTALTTGTTLVEGISAFGTGNVEIYGGTTLGTAGVDGNAIVQNAITTLGDFTVAVEGGNGLLEMMGPLDLGSDPVRTITFSGDGTACFSGIISGSSLTLADSGVGDGVVMICGPDSNTFTGTLTVGANVDLVLAKDPGAVAVSGDLIIENGALVGLDGDNQIASDSTVTVDGALDLFTADEVTLHELYGSGSIFGNSAISGTSTVLVNSGSFTGTITDEAISGSSSAVALVKAGPGTLSLSGANNYSGGTRITYGTLQAIGAQSLGSGPVSLEAGTLDPVGSVTIDSFDWSGGSVASTLGATTDFLEILNDITVGGAGGLFDFSAGAGFVNNFAYALLSADNLDLSMLGFFDGNAIFDLTPFFSIENDTLYVTFNGTPVFTGGVLQNSNPVGIPTFADFIVSGAVTTGAPDESNTIANLIFQPGSSLQVFNNLTVTEGGFTVNAGSASITGGNLIMPGSFSKIGEGLLNIRSNVFVSGPAGVDGGTLLVNGNFVAGGGLTVFQNAILGGSGIIFGDVLNNGLVSPGNSPGTLTIVGDYTQSSTGSLLVEIASPSVYDRLVVTGNAILGGTLEVLASNLKYGQQYAFLQAGSISGDFDQILVSNPDRFRGRFLAEGGTGTLVIAPASYTLVAETTNQRNVAKALDSFIPASGNDRETVSIALDLQSEEQYPAAFDQIAPSFHESLANITIEQAFAQTQQINQRLSAVRLGARGFQAIGIESPLVHDKDGKSVAEAKDLKSNVEAIADTKWNAWVMGNGLFGRVTNVSQVPNYNFNSGGFLVGVDYAWSENFATGLYGGYQYTYADYNAAGNTQINSALFGGYATYDVGGFYADAVVGGGYNGYRARRGIEFSTIDRTARSQPNGGQFNAALNLGYDWEVGKFTFGPIAGVQYTYAGIAPFTETGADSLDLRVAQQNANSLRTTFGGRVAYTWNITETIALIPEVRMFWQHEFLNNPRNISSALDGGSGPTFGYETSAPARDSVFAGAGVSAQFGKNWNAFFFYNADFGRQDYTGHMVSGGVNWKF